MDDTLGTDIKLLGDIGISSTGDIALVSGQDNLKQRIINRLETVQDLYYFGDFGSLTKTLIDRSDPNILDQIQQSVEAALSNEPDIASVDQVNVTQNDDFIYVDIVVTAINDESLTSQTIFRKG